jgi:hypothetical protein
MNSKYGLLIAVMVLALAVMACSVGSVPKAADVAATAKAVATEVKEAVATSTPAPTAKASGAATPTPSTSSDDKPLSLNDRQTGLDKLKSYRMKWQANWKSTEVTSTQSVSWNWIEEFSSAPKGLHWTWVMSDSKQANANINMEWWQIGDTTYMLTKDASNTGQCISFSSSDPQSQLTKGLFSPSALGNVNNAKYVGAETVNGLKTKHYQYDEKGMALFGAAQVKGDLWVAVDGGFVVKETVAWSGSAGLFGSSAKAKGDGKWTWEITDVNANITLKAPENCGGAASDIPVMKDATDQSRFGDTIMYKTPSKLADVVKFYQTQMPAAGWKASGTPQITADLGMLEFTKGSQNAQVMITVESGKTNVIVNVGQ